MDETLAFNEESQVTHHVQADNEAGAYRDDKADYDRGLDVNVLADNDLDGDSSNDKDVLDP
ncbi:hypothetical protein PSY47_23510, partial [Shigella flexneri]|nr:hypothetical protein [Shigella flexneri]